MGANSVTRGRGGDSVGEVYKKEKKEMNKTEERLKRYAVCNIARDLFNAECIRAGVNTGRQTERTFDLCIKQAETIIEAQTRYIEEAE